VPRVISSQSTCAAGTQSTGGIRRITPKLWFVDFPHEESIKAIKSKNPFYAALSQRFDIQLDPVNPEFLVCSLFGIKHYRYSCTKVVWVGENIYPDFRTYDWAFSFDPTKGRNFRLPLWAMQMRDPRALIDPLKKPRELLKHKERFCALAHTNSSCDQHNEIFRILSSTKHIDVVALSNGLCDGDETSAINNLPELYTRYKFTITFENESSPGYTTEKITAPMLGGSVPIYWGNPDIAKEFNPDAFINARDYNSSEDLANFILKVDQTDESYINFLSAPKFIGNVLPEDGDWDVLADRFEIIFSTEIDPISARGLAHQDYRPLLPSFLLQQRRRKSKHKLSRSKFPDFNPTMDIGRSDIPDRIRSIRETKFCVTQKRYPQGSGSPTFSSMTMAFISKLHFLGDLIYALTQSTQIFCCVDFTAWNIIDTHALKYSLLRRTIFLIFAHMTGHFLLTPLKAEISIYHYGQFSWVILANY